MLRLSTTTKKLTATTGYIHKPGDDEAVYDYPIYLGKFDSKDNYREITEEEYNLIKLQLETAIDIVE